MRWIQGRSFIFKKLSQRKQKTDFHRVYRSVWGFSALFRSALGKAQSKSRASQTKSLKALGKTGIKPISLFLLISLFVFSCKGNSESDLRTKLASPDNPPPGALAVPGKESGVSLGLYKTCKAYADYFLSQSILLRIAHAILRLDEPVPCKNAHTCHCYKGLYFAERGNPPFYRCVEPPEAKVEDPKTYMNEEGQSMGVIKFASPKSLCDSEPEKP